MLMDKKFHISHIVEYFLIGNYADAMHPFTVLHLVLNSVAITDKAWNI
jgi:hypothetical protein